MTTTAHLPARVGSAGVLDRAIDAAETRKSADLELLAAAIEWAETHPAPTADSADYARWEHPSLHGEGVVPLGGDGAPLVAEFAADELAAALGWPVAVAQGWMGDGLELAYRLPLLHDVFRRGLVPLHLARYAAEHTRDLTLEAAGYADRLLTRAPAKLTRPRIRALVDEARLYHDPDRALDDERHALAARTVTLHPGSTPATTDVAMTLDTPDALAFDATIAQLAHALHALGDEEPVEVRRARAVGVLADPHHALDLLTGTTDGGTDPGTSVNPRPRPGAVLWLHLDHTALVDLDTFPGAVHIDGLGDGQVTASTDLVKTWLTDTTLTVRPVLDLTRTDAVDAHDPPAWMADLARLRDPHCVFPGCTHTSRACDLDHIDPYLAPDDGGPPGQTHPLNLAPLCRRHHRLKTHTTWTYHRRTDGTHHWTTPHGHTHDVSPPHGGEPIPLRSATEPRSLRSRRHGPCGGPRPRAGPPAGRGALRGVAGQSSGSPRSSSAAVRWRPS